MRVLIIFLITFLIITTVTAFSDSNYFTIAEKRINKYNPKRKDYVIIVDYTKNIFSERLFVLDMKQRKIIISSKVSHAWNSGFLYPSSYSNKNGTNKSCKGNFITIGSKFGSFGYSMVIDGLDRGVNNNARSRAIIFHPDTKMKTKWSNGCFATSESVNKKIIDLTKNGVLVCVID